MKKELDNHIEEDIADHLQEEPTILREVNSIILEESVSYEPREN